MLTFVIGRFYPETTSVADGFVKDCDKVFDNG